MIGKTLFTPMKELPLLPLKELILFPHMVVPFFADSAPLVKLLEEAHKGNQLVFATSLKKDVKNPLENDFNSVGTLAKILQLLRLPDGSVRIIIEGKERGVIQRFTPRKEGYFVLIKPIIPSRDNLPELKGLEKSIREAFKDYQGYYKQLPPEIVSSVEAATDPDQLVDILGGNLKLSKEQKIQLLGFTKTRRRLEHLAVLLASENEMLSLQKEINLKVRKRMEKNQKEYFLNEKIREINRELGRDEEDLDEAKELEERIRRKNPPQEVMDKAVKECRRLSKLQPMSPESGVLRTYLEWISDLPWSERSRDIKDIQRAARILDEDHYNMKKPKERILDFIAVRQLKANLKGPILCFVGPPGTGKTSLGKSVARALGREFVRISLGGVRDEAEIRGHRKTYIGALPGKIIQSMKKAGVMNPVFLLDEIDKINSDFRGDPASALLEVLDPEQNFSFVDHYLEVPFDLSGVMFITTANSLHSIPAPLRDRMEVIEIPGYTEYEKSCIATDFIIPKQIEENGLAEAQIKFQPAAVLKLIREYTMESGVRNLEREIGNLIRKIAREAIASGKLTLPEESDGSTPTGEALGEAAVSAVSAVLNENALEQVPGIEGGDPPPSAPSTTDREEPESPGPDLTAVPAALIPKADKPGKTAPFRYTVTPRSVVKFLGKERFTEDRVYSEVRPGLAHGMAWTEMGGTLLPVEASVLTGSGELILTGSLGDVMKESAKAAHSFLRAHAEEFHLPEEFPQKMDIHIHVPEGAIPKDGPSAGITLTAALLSALTGVPLREKVAMTGEITLTGRVLAIGGVKEKVLAAHRNKMTTVLLPEANRKDTAELPREVTSQMEFVYTASLKEGLAYLLPPRESG